MVKADALYKLGLDYFKGDDVIQDTDIALDYLIKSSKIDHNKAKILAAELLFKQAQNNTSIYYENGYQLGTEMLFDIYRQGDIRATLPYLLNNQLFVELCTDKELQQYYQQAYRLGYKETKFELAKLLFKKGSYHSAEHWFLECLKENISQESNSYLYQIYSSGGHSNPTKAFKHLKESLKEGFIAKEYEGFYSDDEKILIYKEYYNSLFSIEKVQNQVDNIVQNSYYVDDKFKKWMRPEKVKIYIYFSRETKLLDASYSYRFSDIGISDFIYDPIETGDDYFKKTDLEDGVSLENGNENLDTSGFFLCSKRKEYYSVSLKDVFDKLKIGDAPPVLNKTFVGEEINKLAQREITNNIKRKNGKNNLVIRVKKLHLYHALVPSFDFVITYKDKDYKSKEYLLNSREWEPIFEAKEDIFYADAIALNIAFPICRTAFNDLNKVKKESELFKKKSVKLMVAKILSLMAIIWSLIIFLQNVIFDSEFHVSNYSLIKHMSDSPIWFVGGVIVLSTSYYFTRIRIYLPPKKSMRGNIISNPSFVLLQDVNKNHFKQQYVNQGLIFVFAILFILFSRFLKILW